MILRSPLFWLYLGCLVLLGLPSYAVWSREPFVVTRYEFDFFLGLFPAWDGQEPDNDFELIPGKLAHFALVLALGWAYYRLVLRAAAGEDRLRWADLLGASLLAAAAAFFYIPWLSPDVFFYFGTGWLGGHYGLNPYRYVIRDAPGWEADPAFRNVFDHWTRIVTPYGPLWVKFVSAVALLGRGDDRACLLLVKAAFLLAHLANAPLAYGIARALGLRPRAAVAAYLLNPVPLVTLIGWAHNDVLLLTCLLAAVLATLRGHGVAAMVALGVGAGLKYVPVLLAPLFLVYLLRGRSFREAVPRAAGLAAVLLAVVLAPYLMYENGLANFARLFKGQNQLFRNGLYYAAVVTVSPRVEPGVVQAVKLVLKLVFLAAYAAVLARLWRRGAWLTADDFLGGAVVTLLLYFTVGSPEIHEWYAGWFLAFVLWVNDRAYFRLAMVLSVGLNALVIFEVRSPIVVMGVVQQLCFGLMWGGLGLVYWRATRPGSAAPSPLAATP